MEPVKGYREGLNSEGVRGLIYDLTPLGLAQVTAFVDLSKDDGISWLAPNVVESATGEKFFTPYTDVHRSTLERQGVTFYEVLAQCAELVEEVARHNEWLTSPKPVGPPAEEPSGPNYLNQQISHGIELPAEDALAVAAKSVYPVLRVGTNRHEVHAAGELDAIEFGHKYGAKGWADRCAVHTFKLLDVPDFGELYRIPDVGSGQGKYVGRVMARSGALIVVILEDVRQKMLAALSKSQDGLAWLELPAAVKITEADVRAIALVQEIRDRYPDMTVGEFHRLLYDAGWWVTCLVASQPLDDVEPAPVMHLAERILKGLTAMPIDYADYPANWMEIREAILERAGHKCEGCGVPNHEIGIRTRSGIWAKAPVTYRPGNYFAGEKCIKIVLTIAHVDHNIDNNDPANLKAWCQKCHNRHDAPMRARHRARRVLSK